MRRRKNTKHTQLRGCITVTAQECGDDPERMIRKFSRKVKKEGIIEECRERQHYSKPSVIKAEAKRKRRKLIEKENKRKRELFNMTPLLRRKAQRRSKL